MGDVVPTAAVLVAVLTGLATAHSLLRCVVPRWRAAGHGIGVDVWHFVMGAAMVVMLLWPVGRVPSALQVVAFLVGGLWCAWALVAGHGGGAHVRLGVACAVMAGMLVPAATTATSDLPWMSGAAHAAHGGAGGHAGMAMPPTWLAALLLVALGGVVVAAARTAATPSGRGLPARLCLTGEVVMAGAMGWMMVGAL